MTELQRLELRASEIRTRLNELAGVSEWTAEQRAENDQLTSEFSEVESRRRSALITQAEQIERTVPVQDRDDPEGRELRALEQRAQFRPFLEAALGGRLDGAELELQQAHGLTGAAFPITMLQAEERAVATIHAGTTTNTADNYQAPAREVVPQVFPASATTFLGIETPTIPAGQANYPVMVGGAGAGSTAFGTAHAEGTGEIEIYTLEPERVQAALRYNRKQQALLPEIDSAFRMNLSDALSSAMDNQVLNRATDGLYAALAAPADATAEAAYADYRSLITGRVDGVYASGPMEVRALIGPATYVHAESKFRGDHTEESAYEMMKRISGGVMVCSHVPAVASKDQIALTARATGLTHAVAPIWMGVDVIHDEVTSADKGEIVLTAIMLFNVKVVRAAGFTLVDLQVES